MCLFKMDKPSDIAQPHYLVQRIPALWQPFFGRPAKMTMHFLLKNPCLYSHLVITATFFGPIGDHINGVPLHLKLYVITMLMTKINQCLSPYETCSAVQCHKIASK